MGETGALIRGYESQEENLQFQPGLVSCREARGQLTWNCSLGFEDLKIDFCSTLTSSSLSVNTYISIDGS